VTGTTGGTAANGQTSAGPATDAGSTSPAGGGTPADELQQQVAEQTDSLSPNADRAGTRERAVNPEHSGD
jgi:hypothetical protein